MAVVVFGLDRILTGTGAGNQHSWRRPGLLWTYCPSQEGFCLGRWQRRWWSYWVSIQQEKDLWEEGLADQLSGQIFASFPSLIEIPYFVSIVTHIPYCSLVLVLTNVRNASSTVILSTKSWYSSRWQTLNGQYLQWSTALNQDRGRFCFARSRRIWLKNQRFAKELLNLCIGIIMHIPKFAAFICYRWHSLLVMCQNTQHTTMVSRV